MVNYKRRIETERADEDHRQMAAPSQVMYDPEWPQIARVVPDAEAWIKLSERYGIGEVDRAYRYWRQQRK